MQGIADARGPPHRHRPPPQRRRLVPGDAAHRDPGLRRPAPRPRHAAVRRLAARSRRGRDGAQLARAAAVRRGPAAPRPDRRTARSTTCRSRASRTRSARRRPSTPAGWPGTSRPRRSRTWASTPASTSSASRSPTRRSTRTAIRAVADEVSTRVQRAGIPVFGSYVPVPGRHPANDLLQGFFLVLGFIGALALVVSGFLVVNTVSAILAQQTRQIGIMKAIGARNGQIAGLYLVLVLAYAVLALAVALPLGALGAYALRPVHRGPRQLRHRRGLDPARGHRARGRHRARRPPARRPRPDLPRRPDHRARGAGLDGHRRPLRPRPLRPPAARHPGPAAPDAAVDPQHVPPQGTAGPDARRAGPGRRDLHVGVLGPRVARQDPRRHARLLRLRRPGGAGDDRADVGPRQRGDGGAGRRRRRAVAVRLDGVVDAGGTEGPQVVAFGLPPNAQTVRPVVQEGRWLLPDDGNALVATANVRDDNPDLAVGDTVTLRIDGKDTAWTLVGIVQSPTRRPFFYAPDVALERATSEVGPGRRADGRRARRAWTRPRRTSWRRRCAAGSRGPGSRSPRRRRRARSASPRSCCSTSSCCSCRRWRCCWAWSAASGSRGR